MLIHNTDFRKFLKTIITQLFHYSNKDLNVIKIKIMFLKCNINKDKRFNLSDTKISIKESPKSLGIYVEISKKKTIVWGGRPHKQPSHHPWVWGATFPPPPPKKKPYQLQSNDSSGDEPNLKLSPFPKVSKLLV